MKITVIKFISFFVRKFYFLIFSKTSSKLEESILQKFTNSEFSVFNLILMYSFKKEFISFANERDLLWMRDSENFYESSSFLDYLEEFKEFSKSIIYEPGGMYNVQLFSLYSMIRDSKPEVHIESGTKNGYSAIFAAEAIKKNRDEGANSIMFSLSLFNGDEKERTLKKLENYSFVEVIEGESQINIDKVFESNRGKTFSCLIDGPKPRQEAWDILVEKIAKNYSKLIFLSFDACQEHIPYFMFEDNYPLKRGINVERIKVQELFIEKFKKENFKISIQSNDFQNSFFHLNQSQLEKRNNEWGKDLKYDKFIFDKISGHVASGYKLGTIFNPEYFSKQ